MDLELFLCISETTESLPRAATELLAEIDFLTSELLSTEEFSDLN